MYSAAKFELKKKIVVTSDKQISPSTDEILAIMQSAPPFPILDQAYYRFADRIQLSRALVSYVVRIVSFDVMHSIPTVR